MFLYIIATLGFCVCAPVDDPSQWPGHLEPFGSKQKMVNIGVRYSWPKPSEFFQEYVDKSKPMLFKGIYKQLKAVQYWNDDEYLGNNDFAEKEIVYVEPYLKENRTAYGYEMSFKNFTQTYKKNGGVMFSTIPKHLMQDVLLPAPLTCNETSKHVLNVNLHMSQGGTKSVVCREDLETIYCALQGTVDFLLIEYTKNKNYVIDNLQGGYSTLDVERVDYVNHSQLRKVDQYWKAQLKEGDCLYIPYRWFKQMNGHANSYGRNIGLNVWFYHLHDHRPVNCPMNEYEATLDKFSFFENFDKQYGNMKMQDEEIKIESTDEEDLIEMTPELERGFDILERFKKYVSIVKDGKISLQKFLKIIRKDRSILANLPEEPQTFPKSFYILPVQIFKKLDVNTDNFITDKDFDKIFNSKQKMEKLPLYLDYQVVRIQDYVEDLVEAKYHDEPMHLFEERMIEKFRLWRKFEL